MLNLYFLKYFYDAAKLGSVTKAAKANLVSPSAISQSLKRLEEQLELTLLDHGQNRFQLTKAGADLFVSCGQIFLTLGKLESDLKHNLDSDSTEIHGIASQSLSIWMMPKIVKALQEEFSNLKFRHEIGNSRAIKEKLERNDVDFAIAVDDHHLSKFNFTHLTKGKFVLVRRPGARSNKFIVGDEGHEVRILRDRYFAAYKKEPSILCHVQSWNAIRSHVEAGLGIGLLPEFCADKFERVHPEWNLSTYQIGLYVTPKCSPKIMSRLKLLKGQL